AFQLSVEHDAHDAHTLASQAFGSPDVRAVDVGVVRELTPLDVAGVEGLARLVIRTAMRLQHRAAMLRERQQRGPNVVIRVPDDPHETGGPETIQITVPEVAGTATFVMEIAQWDHAKCAHGAEGSHFGPT